MSDFFEPFLWSLLRTTCWLVIAAALTSGLLLCLRASSPKTHRIGRLSTLLVGWSFLQMPLAVHWYAAAESSALPGIANLELPRPSLAAATPIAKMEVPDPLISVVAAPTLLKEAAKPPVGWPMILFCSWLAGMVLGVAAWVFGYARFLRRLPKGLPVSEEWDNEWQELLQAHGVRPPITLRATKELGPMLCRLPRGYELLVPQALWKSMLPAQRAAILRHELEHYLRGDLWKSLTARLLALPHWFNPVAWWTVRKFDEAAEWACDQAAAGEESSSIYAQALLQLGEAVSGQSSYGHAARGSVLASRIRRVLSSPSNKDTAMKWTLLIACVSGIAIMAFVRIDLVAKEPEEKAVSEKTAEIKEKGSEAEAVSEPQANQEQLDQLVATAREAYKSTKAAYEADTVTQDLFTSWSSKLLEAELLAARTPTQRVQAFNDYVTRTKELVDRIKGLYEQGGKGGELDKYLAAQYYHTDAQRRLAEEMQKQSRQQLKNSQASLSRFVAQEGAIVDSRAASLPSPEERTEREELARIAREAYKTVRENYDAGTVTFDLQTDWSARLLEAELMAADSRHKRLAALETYVGRTKEAHERVKTLHDQGIRGGELDKLLTAEFLYADAKRRLAREKRQGSSAATPSQKSFDRTQLRYDGKTFEQWREQLLTELKIESRIEAMKAFREFASRGYAAEVAKLVMDEPDHPDLQDWRIGALGAVPEEIRVPLLIKALESKDLSKRRFAATAFTQSNVDSRSAAVPHLIKAMSDSDSYVRHQAIWALLIIAPDNLDFLKAIPARIRDSSNDVSTVAVGVLERSLQSNSMDVQIAAIEIIGDLGAEIVDIEKQCPGLSKQIEQLGKSKNERVQKALKDARDKVERALQESGKEQTPLKVDSSN